MGRGWIAIIVSGVILACLYAALLVPASTGQGYARTATASTGRSYGPSFWYFGGPTIFHERPSVRAGSRGGPQQTGGGLRGGK